MVKNADRALLVLVLEGDGRMYHMLEIVSADLSWMKGTDHTFDAAIKHLRENSHSANNPQGRSHNFCHFE